AEAPAALRVQSAGQSVHDRIDVGANVQAPNSRVVANIHDNVYIFLRDDLHKATQEFGRAGPAGENGVMGRSHAIILRGAQGWGPELKDNGGEEVPHIFDVSLGDFPIEKTEDCPR